MTEGMRGSFKISQQTIPVGRWLWSLQTVEGTSLLSSCGHESPEAAAEDVCQVLRTLGVSDVEIWIERKVRTRYKCKRFAEPKK